MTSRGPGAALNKGLLALQWLSWVATDTLAHFIYHVALCWEAVLATAVVN